MNKFIRLMMYYFVLWVINNFVGTIDNFMRHIITDWFVRIIYFIQLINNCFIRIYMIIKIYMIIRIYVMIRIYMIIRIYTNNLLWLYFLHAYLIVFSYIIIKRYFFITWSGYINMS